MGRGSPFFKGQGKGNSPKQRSRKFDTAHTTTGGAKRKVSRKSLVNGNTMKPKSPVAGSGKPPKARGQKFG